MAMLVSSNSMKVARVTVMAMSQGLIAGLATVGAADVLNDPESACVPTDQLLVYAVNWPPLRDAYAVYIDAKIYLFELPGNRFDDYFFHALGFFPRIALAGGN